MGFSVETGVPVITVFIQGILSFFSPCVLPLVPLYVSYLAGGTKTVEVDGTIRYPRGRVMWNTLFFVLVSWTIFAIEDFGQLGEYLKVMFGLGGVPLIDGAFKYYAANYLPVLCISALAATPLGAAVYRRLNVRTAHILGAVLILAGLLLCTAYLVDGTYNPFLYFRF